MFRASIVMACRNGEPWLRETLEAIARQEWDQPWELVMADNGSTDASLATFHDVAARHPHLAMVAVDASGTAGKSYAMNRGVAAARSDAIIVCDNDDIPAPGWLRAMGEALQRHDFVACRREIDLLNTGPTGKYRGVPASGVWQLRFAPFSDCTAGSTMGFTRRLFDAVGGFDPEFQPEDIDFCIKADLKGFRLQPVPEALIHYRLRTDLKSIWRQAHAYHKCDVKVAKHYRDYGPPQRARWRSLALALAKNGLQYLVWRLRPGKKDMAEGAGIYWRLGALAGQLDGIRTWRAAPTSGLPPLQPTRPPRMIRREESSS